MANETTTSFAIALEPSNIIIHCKPEEINFEARLLSASGAIIQSIPVKDGNFALNISPDEMKGKRLIFAPINPRIRGVDGNEANASAKENLSTRNVNQSGLTYEPVLPDKLSSSNQLTEVPSSIWQYWCYCLCRVRGRVFNNCDGTYSPVNNARVHFCEVERIWFWLMRLPDPIILQIRDSILNPEIIQQVPPIPPIGPGPVETFSNQAMSPGSAQLAKAALQSRMAVASMQTSLGNKTDVSKLSAEILPQENISVLHANSAYLVREYLIQNYRVLFPWWCYWIPIYWWWWYTCIEESTVYTNEQGWFDSNIYYNCFDDSPDLYFWVEYNINGIWTTVYDPPIYCNTYWDYECGTEVDIYLNDERIPCPGNPTVPGKVVIVSTLGNNANVNRVLQTSGANQGLAPDLGYGYTDVGPFGGSVEPHVFFGDELIPAGVKYYRWSYKPHGAPDTDWAIMQENVDRHYFHTNPDLSTSFPTYNLGPKTGLTNNDLFEIQTSRNPITNEPWYILDARTDTATAYFETNSLNNGNVAAAAGLYDLKLEFFDVTGAQVNLTDLGISLQVPDPTQPAPFGNATVNNVVASPVNQLLDIYNKLLGFIMTIRVDNNPTYANIHETVVGVNSAGPCGMIPYYDKANDKAHIAFEAFHPNNYAFFGFTITKGSSGVVHEVTGMVSDSPLATVTDTPVSTPETYSYNSTNDQFDTDIHVSKLLGDCNDAAFAEVLNVYATATDGWSRLSGSDFKTGTSYDSSDVKAFALKYVTL